MEVIILNDKHTHTYALVHWIDGVITDKFYISEEYKDICEEALKDRVVKRVKFKELEGKP